MFDIVYAIWEDDMIPQWEQHGEVKDAMRSKTYELLYGRAFKYGNPTMASPDTTSFGLPHGTSLDEIPELPDVPVESRVTKSYIPPTDPGDLESLIGPPVN